ncbi:MAG: hypothetical protein CMJ89_14505 [Planctomycetes bacterium]|jgi:prepilin-type N-terminal cleavage/methylation domain-containing protein|nr:hypothetical protein [Planctomycetota bacterium]
MRVPNRPISFRRAAFTLIELLAVILIIGILATALLPMVTDAVGTAKVTACAKNMQNLYQGLLIYRSRYKEIPKESGVRFFADLISRRAIDNTKTNAERLTCPSIEKSALAIGALDWEDWWTDLELVDGSYSAYAGRDMRRFPLRRFPDGAGSEPLIADDNDGGMNHDVVTNVLYGDGSVQTFNLPDLVREGLIMEEQEVLEVGPDSPVEDLTKLSLD